MDDTILIQLTNKKALKLLQDMEDLNLIKMLGKNDNAEPINLADKYKNVFTKEDAINFEEYINTMRKEWKNI